jgi:hypothetical protein
MNAWTLVSALLALALIVSVVQRRQSYWDQVELAARVGRNAGSGEIAVPAFTQVDGRHWVGTLRIKHNRFDGYWFNAPADGVVTEVHATIAGNGTIRLTLVDPVRVTVGSSLSVSP